MNDIKFNPIFHSLRPDRRALFTTIKRRRWNERQKTLFNVEKRVAARMRSAVQVRNFLWQKRYPASKEETCWMLWFEFRRTGKWKMLIKRKKCDKFSFRRVFPLSAFLMEKLNFHQSEAKFACATLANGGKLRNEAFLALREFNNGTEMRKARGVLRLLPLPGAKWKNCRDK